MTQEEHFDVASYALGVLDARDAARFEDHLIECQRCAYDLESFVDVADLLAEVDAGAVIAAEESRKDGIILHNIMGEVEQERRRADSRRLYSLAAAVVVFAMLSIGAFFVGGRVAGDNKPKAPVTAQGGSSQQDSVPIGEGPGLGGPDLPGQRYSGTDPRTGVHLDVAVEKKDMGTQVSFAVSNLKGPKVCRLVAVRKDGTIEPLTSWTVTERGWGTQAFPRPLVLSAITSTPREDMPHFQVQEIGTGGTTTTLVGVPEP